MFGVYRRDATLAEAAALGTRRKCLGVCGTYFTPASSTATICPDCLDKAANGRILQDNGTHDWHQPVEPAELIALRIAQKRMEAKLEKYRLALLALHADMVIVATPRLLPTDQRKHALSSLERFESNFPGMMDEVIGGR